MLQESLVDETYKFEDKAEQLRSFGGPATLQPSLFMSTNPSVHFAEVSRCSSQIYSCKTLCGKCRLLGLLSLWRISSGGRHSP